MTTKGLAKDGEINTPVAIGGVAVSPGDLVLADANGILVLSPRLAEKLIDIAETRQAGGAQLPALLKSGARISEVRRQRRPPPRRNGRAGLSRRARRRSPTRAAPERPTRGLHYGYARGAANPLPRTGVSPIHQYPEVSPLWACWSRRGWYTGHGRSGPGCNAVGLDANWVRNGASFESLRMAAFVMGIE